MATKKFVCKVCGYVHEGNAAPDKCPLCGAPASQFEEVKEKKKGFLGGKDSNAYIIFYSVVMVVIVAVLLAVAAMSLQNRQNENMLDEKKQQIVTALGENPESVKYGDVIVASALLDKEGNVTSEDEKDVFAAVQNLKGSIADGVYPIFRTAEGAVVVPVYGAGLWDAIWGYVALEPDMNTIKGIVLDHKGETPGLGAEIATAKHQAKYVGKTIYDGEQLVGITLKKGGAKESDAAFAHEVDAITGGTKTSDGVTAMLHTCLNNYKPYFDAVRNAAAAKEEAVSNELNNENNEQ